MGKRAAWRLVDRDENTLPPLVYSTRKTQEDVVNEALEALDDHDVVFLMGGVGTGKSAIALHLLDYYGKGIISTPTKILEKQYKDDYCGPGGMRLKKTPTAAFSTLTSSWVERTLPVQIHQVCLGNPSTAEIAASPA